VGRTYNCLMLNLLVHDVTSRLWKIKVVKFDLKFVVINLR